MCHRWEFGTFMIVQGYQMESNRQWKKKRGSSFGHETVPCGVINYEDIDALTIWLSRF